VAAEVVIPVIAALLDDVAVTVAVAVIGELTSAGVPPGVGTSSTAANAQS
jgi:hypothetical protein